MIRGVAVADLVPIEHHADVDPALAELERAGIVRVGTNAFSSELDRAGPKLRGGPSAATVRTEREGGW